MNERILTMKKLLPQNKLDGLLINKPQEWQYLLKIYKSIPPMETRGALLLTQDKIILIVDPLTLRKIKDQLSPQIQVIIGDGDACMRMGGLFVKEIKKEIKKEKIREIGVFSNYHSSLISKETKSVFIKENPLIKMADTLNDYEIKILKEASTISDQVFLQMLKKLKVGITEIELRNIIEKLLFKLGADFPSFGTLVSFGENTNAIHAISSNRALKLGDLVMVDFGALVNGIGSDITRTFVYGTANIKQKNMWKAVQKAQASALKSIRSGISGKKIDLISRDVIKRQGYGDYYFHSLGHQLGMLNGTIALHSNCKQRLKSNMALTVEPGIYTEWGGIRLEDDIIVTKNGCINLTKAPKEFQL